MESFAVDRSLYDVGDNDLKDIWESDFSSPVHEGLGNDHDWATILDSHPVILNDRMITDALQSPRITSEHSYSLVTSEDVDMPNSPLGAPLDQDLESECFPAIPMTSATNGNTEAYIKQEPISAPSSPQLSSTSTGSSSVSLLKQPTIILAARQAASSNPRCIVFPKVNIKLEPPTSASESKGFCLPPTPPSSTSSDSEGSSSPVHSQQPSSPIAPGALYSPPRRSSSVGNSLATRPVTNATLISSQPKGATGVLTLTEEEKRTLLAEGYPIPSRLPLTKTEEKSLKKIRRKIKNKISAQESRRKKKEYMDALEKKVEILAFENTEHKKKLESLETNNTSLLLQLQRLQALLGDIPNKMARSVSTQTTTTLTVFLFCFAVFLGSWGPLQLIRVPSFTYHAELSKTFHEVSPVLVTVRNQDQYSTQIKPSRTLLSFLEERDCGNENLKKGKNSNVIATRVLHQSFDSIPKDPGWESASYLKDTPISDTNATLSHYMFI